MRALTHSNSSEPPRGSRLNYHTLHSSPEDSAVLG